jgi:hypothetical protein
MSIVLSTIGSRGVTVEVGPAAVPEAPGGIVVTYGLREGPLTVTLTEPEARELHVMLAEQLGREERQRQGRGVEVGPLSRAGARVGASELMASHRCCIDTSAGPAREGILGGRSMLLVRVRLCDGPSVVSPSTGLPAAGEDVYADLRPGEARELASRLLERAEQAERVTEHAGWWQR